VISRSHTLHHFQRSEPMVSSKVNLGDGDRPEPDHRLAVGHFVELRAAGEVEEIGSCLHVGRLPFPFGGPTSP